MFKQFQKASLGKKLGTISYFITELIIIATIIMSLINSKDVAIDYTQIIFYQTLVFSVVWGAKASSNFAKKLGVRNETVD